MLKLSTTDVLVDLIELASSKEFSLEFNIFQNQLSIAIRNQDGVGIYQIISTSYLEVMYKI